MALSMQLDYRLRWMDVDRYGRIKPSAVLDILQDVATLQANSMGIGNADMQAKGVFWVVVRLKYEVVRQPHRLQVVTARTWPHTPSRMSFLRDFAVFDEEGELLIKASSEWVVLDIETRSFVRMTDIYDGPEDFCEDRAFERKPRKIASFEGNLKRSCTLLPQYCDMDQNGHVNNARYADLAMNALNPGPEGEIVSFQIDFRHEVLPDTLLDMQVLVEDGIARIKGVRDDGDIAFACEMTFE
ncbi:MAG: hypothetical protein J5804_00740 [Eggerthellaceae bacterium]|nr:hypothetical protein [Eggerthellaceae bacterium]